MQKHCATTVVANEAHDHIVLILRRDFRIWALPGGRLEAGETAEQAASRETFEESGYEVKIEESGPETLAVNWYSIDQLPKRLAPSVREIVLDTLVDCDKPIEKKQILHGGR